MYKATMCYTRYFPVLLLCMLGVLALPAQAQNTVTIGEEGPTISFGIKAMTGIQYLDNLNDEEDRFVDLGSAPGFYRPRFNFEIGAQINDRISLFADIAHEPNDFGTGGGSFAPALDYFVVDFLLAEGFTFQFGTPVTVLFNYRGYSDGAAVQGNPLIGNSPADMVTAESGIGFYYSQEQINLALTITDPTFFESFTEGQGFNYIFRANSQITPNLGIGGAFSFARHGDQLDSGNVGPVQTVSYIVGDGENYHFPVFGTPNRITHSGSVPGLDVNIVHFDTKIDFEPVSLVAWYGYAWDDFSFAATGDTPTRRVTEDGFTPVNTGVYTDEEGSSLDFFGATLKLDVTERFYLAGRGTLVTNRSDYVDEDASMFRIQAGFGVRFYEVALFKFEFVSQTEERFSPGQIGDDWYGLLGELSVSF